MASDQGALFDEGSSRDGGGLFDQVPAEPARDVAALCAAGVAAAERSEAALRPAPVTGPTVTVLDDGAGGYCELATVLELPAAPAVTLFDIDEHAPRVQRAGEAPAPTVAELEQATVHDLQVWAERVQDANAAVADHQERRAQTADERDVEAGRVAAAMVDLETVIDDGHDLTAAQRVIVRRRAIDALRLWRRIGRPFDEAAGDLDRLEHRASWVLGRTLAEMTPAEVATVRAIVAEVLTEHATSTASIADGAARARARVAGAMVDEDGGSLF